MSVDEHSDEYHTLWEAAGVIEPSAFGREQ